MPYLPPLKVDGTQFPQALGPDVITAIKMIEERWRRSYPLLPYTMIDSRNTAVSSPSELTGEAGASKFDPMWGETVPATDTKWQQPHTRGVAAEPTIYHPAVGIHGRIQRTLREDELKKFGFDRVRNLIVTFPTSLLDAAGITVRAGDRFTWNSELFEIVQQHVVGWWHATNVNLYVVTNVQSARKGS
jgi:hypothetical protein